MKFKVLLVIPARYGSTRLPGKPLKKIGNKTMIQHVYERAKKVNCSKTIIATDDKRILKHCLLNKMNCVMTKKSHETGSDRVSEVCKKYNYQWVLNLQGDEPLINIKDVKNLIRKTLAYNKKNKKFSVSTLYFKKKETNEYNPNEARLLINKKNEVLIFSRKKITNTSKEKSYLKHIGIFFYRKDFLVKFSKLKERFLERDQKLEQLRVIENGYKIIAFRASSLTTGVDNYKDLCNIRENFK